MIDLSHLQPDPPPPTVRIRKRDGARILVPKARVIGGKVVVRDPKSITGITLHQTACYFGPGKVRARESRIDKIHARALRVHAHVTCFSTGEAVLGFPRLWHVFHGHDFCDEDVGHEHEGLFDEDGNVFDAPPGYELERVIVAGRMAIEADLEALPNIRYVHLHRQTTNKPACPGRVITREVGLWACRKFGLMFEPERVHRDGSRVPMDWLVESRAE